MRINLDSPIVRGLSGVFDTVLTVTLGIVCSIPILTVGPALCAMWKILLAVAQGERDGILRGYFCAFRENFRQALPLGLLLCAVGAVVALDWWICWGFQHEASVTVSVMRGLTLGCTVLYFGWASYLLAGLAHYCVTVRQAIRNSVIWAVRNPACTFGLVITKTVCVAAIYFLWYLCFPILWIAAFLDAKILNKVFDARTEKKNWRNPHV